MVQPLAPVATEPPRPAAVSGTDPTGSRWLALPLGLGAALLVFLALPIVSGSRGLQIGLAAASGVLVLGSLALWIARRGTGFPVAVEVVKAHWIQASVQLCIYVYWASYWREFRLEAPLILAQIVYLYGLLALLAWSRGRVFRLGFGPVPVIFSTNLLLWFKAEWFFLQFAMVTAGALGKEFVQWRRDGRRTHIFNPSVFGQSLAAVALIATASTFEFTWGAELAAAFETLPDAYLLLFVLGLIVQYHFSVTLVTFGATLALVLANLAYHQTTGLYYFVSVNIGATIFLGLHLLVTDPSTSPRSNTGRLLFGFLYGALYFGLFRVFESFDVPPFWDKLLPVPILNLLVPAIERVSRFGPIGRFNRWWEAFRPDRANLVHMAVWSAFFLSLLGTGFLSHDHPGKSIAFWRSAAEAGDARAEAVLVEQLQYGAALGGKDELNMLGALHLAGQFVPEDRARAAHYFARACEQGHGIACLNVVSLYLYSGEARSLPDVSLGLDYIESHLDEEGDGEWAFLLALAHERGAGRPKDVIEAQRWYTRAEEMGHPEARAFAERLLPQVLLEETRRQR
ncbi:MAG: hypothetical protein GC161_11360 [Planctomycetaceae bacterium]|nr:hypothetical protein [Planctomycetaceae bacterium]